MNLPTFIAFRHLRSPQKGSFSTLAGILAIAGLGIGIAALIITLSILEGFETTISEKIAGFDGHIRLQHFMDTPVPEENPILDSLLGISLGQTVIPFIQKPALLRRGSYAEGVIVEGLVVPDKKFGLTHIIVDGTLNLNPGSILIGKRLADNMSLQVGDKLALFDMESITGVSSGQRVKSFTITGLFHSGLLEYDRSIVYTSLKDAQHLFGMEKQISGLMLLFKNSALAGAAYSQLEAELDYPWYVMSWKDKHHVLFDWIRVQRWPILIIFGLIAFVGVVNIVSAMAMIIIEKIREIGIFTSLGFTPHAIRRVFLFEALQQLHLHEKDRFERHEIRDVNHDVQHRSPHYYKSIELSFYQYHLQPIQYLIHLLQQILKDASQHHLHQLVIPSSIPYPYAS